MIWLHFHKFEYDFDNKMQKLRHFMSAHFPKSEYLYCLRYNKCIEWNDNKMSAPEKPLENICRERNKVDWFDLRCLANYVSNSCDAKKKIGIAIPRKLHPKHNSFRSDSFEAKTTVRCFPKLGWRTRIMYYCRASAKSIYYIYLYVYVCVQCAWMCIEKL